MKPDVDPAISRPLRRTICAASAEKAASRRRVAKREYQLAGGDRRSWRRAFSCGQRDRRPKAYAMDGSDAGTPAYRSPPADAEDRDAAFPPADGSLILFPISSMNVRTTPPARKAGEAKVIAIGDVRKPADRVGSWSCMDDRSRDAFSGGINADATGQTWGWRRGRRRGFPLLPRRVHHAARSAARRFATRTRSRPRRRQ